MNTFHIQSEFTPKGDQPQAIKKLTQGVHQGEPHQVLLGVTGSGKTFTMANVIEKLQKPALVLAPNKTLAAQLYNEFKSLFPENAVEYFVSYYDYYQPEAYLPTTDTYIQKDASINEMIDKLRHSATRSVLSQNDVIIVASVSCIYGLGAPEDYISMRLDLTPGMAYQRDRLLKDLVHMLYERNDIDFHRGVFRVRGDRVEIFPAYEEDRAVRIDFFGDEIDDIREINPLTGESVQKLKRVIVYPASHYVITDETFKYAIETIKLELKSQIDYFHKNNMLIEAQRIEERTLYDLEMILELGYCNGIENYSRHLTGRKPGEPPPTLFDYFPDDFIMFIDESHIAVPQLIGMYRGDRARKETLVRYGFRLPSALDNRPLKFEEFNQKVSQIIYVSATPADYEREKAGKSIVEQIVRPTGLIDPEITIRPAKHQVDDLLDEIKTCIDKQTRVLVTTLTKRMAEDLSEYYHDLGILVKYLHSEIKTLERMDIISDLRAGKFDVLVGINLLREGLDIPEVGLVAILDADKEGFLRSTRSLIQTFGRAARNVNGRVILYADNLTKSMKTAIDETERRRKRQKAFNKKHSIQPESIAKDVTRVFFPTIADSYYQPAQKAAETVSEYIVTPKKIAQKIKQLEKEMLAAAKAMEFERAAELRDEIQRLKDKP
ncbi:MAG: UvrABC system protein B [Candidatus Magnetoglobus multicellularis str. Araruama]|uniref:UvrABC system protein B n=1 Tax=Candidatus Magnetoglobus multicellularis str. Araruama TaxID=890399 RepID=A0A1V1PHS8_9BACT|nr:MAG: UvrABC system protein B [Candidatus Magnetoglobus multicellularis str. Araruama]